jgi:hypothetical protein
MAKESGCTRRSSIASTCFGQRLPLGLREAVAAVVSDDHNAERGRHAARAVVHAVLAKAGREGLTDMAVEL